MSAMKIVNKDKRVHKCSITLYKQTEPTETVELYTGLPTWHHARLCEKACGLTVLQPSDIHNNIGATLYSLHYSA